jgi:aminoglycoside phosphotransferase (APT) family kinase protein
LAVPRGCGYRSVSVSHQGPPRSCRAVAGPHVHIGSASCCNSSPPRQGPAYYLEHLRLDRETLQRAIVNSTLSRDDLVVLESIVSRCNVLESCWSKVERFCAKMPQTLVHNDFATRNIRVRNGQAGTALLPFDWEKAGWGIPAADLECHEQADLAIYWSVVHRSWPYLDVKT